MIIGLLVFPGLTQLDLTGPYEVFARMQGSRVLLVGPSLEPVTTELGLVLVPDVTREECPQLDILCVPGGPGVNVVMEDPVWLDFIRSQEPGLEKLTSVCTGSLVLAAAGLLQGYRATSHWNAVDLLEAFGAIPVRERVVVDRNRCTGAGVSAGIELALEVAGVQAERIALMIEHETGPDPRVRSELVESMRQSPLRKQREELVRRLTNYPA